MDKKLRKVRKIKKIPVCKHKSPNFAQNQLNFAPSHDGETVTFRNSESDMIIDVESERLIIVKYDRMMWCLWPLASGIW